jgi:polysaccharide biosynthesis protein PslH
MSDDLLVVSATPVYPPSDGISLRCYNLLVSLCRRWRVTVVSPPSGTSVRLADAIPDLHRHIETPLDGAWRVVPWQFDTRRLEHAVSTLAREQNFSAAVLWPGAEFLCLRPDFPPSVVDRIDCAALTEWRYLRSDSSLAMKVWRAANTMRTAAYEWRVAAAAARTVLIGEADQRAMTLAGMIGRSEVVPNGVHPCASTGTEQSAVPTVVFTGVLDYSPNTEAVLWFAQQIWPLVREKVPHARFVAAGRRPPTRIQQLSAIDGVEIRGDVPSIPEVLAEAWLSVAPMRSGSGLKNKILEAWSCGRPVVGTSMAMNGLMYPETMKSLISDDPEGLASITAKLLLTTEWRLQLSARAREHAMHNYSWEKIGSDFAGIVEDVMRSGKRGARTDG